MEIKFMEELKKFIVPLTNEEKSQLEENIKVEGCRDPLIVWKSPKGENVLIDGHNRYQICQKHNIPFEVVYKEFESTEEVKTWMIDNQLGRRNLNPDQLSFYRGLKYERVKQKKGGYDKVLSKGQNGLSTSKRLADAFNVSEKTIKRDAKFSQGLQLIATSNPDLKNAILIGKAKVKKADIQLLADYSDKKGLSFKNEADLFNKVKKLRKKKEKEEQQQEQLEQEAKLQEAQDILKAQEPVFNTKEDRIYRIKADIISAVNRAINKKEKTAIKDLNTLTKKLEKELF